MKKNDQQEQPVKTTPRSIIHFQANAANRIGNVRSVTLDNRVINTNHLPETMDTIQESVEKVFDKVTR